MAPHDEEGGETTEEEEGSEEESEEEVVKPAKRGRTAPAARGTTRGSASRSTSRSTSRANQRAATQRSHQRVKRKAQPERKKPTPAKSMYELTFGDRIPVRMNVFRPRLRGALRAHAFFFEKIV